MSEYQHYEFQAIDHSLTQLQIRELRSYSTGATITSMRFVNWAISKATRREPPAQAVREPYPNQLARRQAEPGQRSIS
jgi:hypothetical protein